MVAMPDPRPNPDTPSLDPNRPLEPRRSLNAEHATPTMSLLILAGLVAVVLAGGWMLSGSTSGPAVALKQAPPPAAPATTGAAPAR